MHCWRARCAGELTRVCRIETRTTSPTPKAIPGPRGDGSLQGVCSGSRMPLRGSRNVANDQSLPPSIAL
jgi:hypothetical protein